MTIWVAGASGLLGSEVVRCARNRGWTVVLSGRSIDIADFEAVRSFAFRSGFMTAAAPRRIINCAAWTAVDAAEFNPAACWRVNSNGAAVAARMAVEAGASLVQMSSDYVFGGEPYPDGSGGPRPWRHDDQVSPVNVYGASKAAGEFRALDACGQTTIVRSSWLFRPGGADFVAAILRRLLLEGSASVVNDQVGCPTSAPDLAEALCDLLALSELPRGIIHMCGDEPISWYGFARAIRESAVSSGIIPATAEVRPMDSAELDRPACRPSWSVLSTESLRLVLGRSLPSWRKALPTCIEASRL